MISIIIPTVPGNEATLRRCVLSIVENTEGDEYELIVVKNDFWGFAKAVNYALKKVGKNDVVLLNDDTVVTTGWLEDFKKAAEKYDLICVHGNLRPEHMPFWGVYIKNEVVNKVGLLDERFEMGEWEDVDYCIRAIDAGFKLGETENVLVVHPSPSTTLHKLNFEQRKKRQENKQKFLEKWQGTRWEKRIDRREW